MSSSSSERVRAGGGAGRAAGQPAGDQPRLQDSPHAARPGGPPTLACVCKVIKCI